MPLAFVLNSLIYLMAGPAVIQSLAKIIQAPDWNAARRWIR